jgi:hypothetical protein
MLTKTLRTMTVAVALAVATPFLAAAAGPNGLVPGCAAPCYAGPGAYGQAGNGPGGGPHGPSVPVGTVLVPLSADEASDLVFMREEEKMARDLYLGFAGLYPAAPFAYIANSEQNHMDAMLRLLVKYGLPDPTAGMLIGEYADPTLQALYADLSVQGPSSELDALKAGGYVEEVDIQDLDQALAVTTKADLQLAYGNLSCGSRNHLRAFAAGIVSATGTPYVAQYMPQAAVDAIIALPFERCGPSR